MTAVELPVGDLGTRSFPQPRERLADQPRDLHLRDADALADLRLRHVLGEAQAQDLALARTQAEHQPVEGRSVLGEAEAGVVAADRVGERLALVLGAGAW